MTNKIIEKEKLSGRYSIRCIKANKGTPIGAGDCGFLLESVDPLTFKRVGEMGEIILGKRIRCGSLYARSYSDQDWWMTSVVTKIYKKQILKDGSEKVKFKTLNSTYIAKGI